MRYFIRKLGQVNLLFMLFSLALDIGRAFCIFTPLAMLTKSSFVVFLVSIIVFLLNYSLPVIAWLAHLIIWIISIFPAAHCQDPDALKQYLICAAAYFLVEILGTGFIVIAGSKKPRR